MYKGILINKQEQYVAGEDFDFIFVIMDDNGDYVSDFTNWTFRAELYSLANSIENESITITASGHKVTVSLPNSETEDLNDNVNYVLVLKGTLNSKDYNLVREELYIKSEILD